MPISWAVGRGNPEAVSSNRINLHICRVGGGEGGWGEGPPQSSHIQNIPSALGVLYVLCTVQYTTAQRKVIVMLSKYLSYIYLGYFVCLCVIVCVCVSQLRNALLFF
jgi:hypothetical protein